MQNRDLLTRLGAFGFTLFEPETKVDVNKTLAELVTSGDARLWEGFPVVLANGAEKAGFDYAAVRALLKNPPDRSSLESLTLMALALYKSVGVAASWAEKAWRDLPSSNMQRAHAMLKRLNRGDTVQVGTHLLSGQRLKTVFHNYFVQSQANLSGLLESREELSLEYALSQLFSPRQKELLFKKLRREKMTKTEREYFSRVVRKKVRALANPDVHRLAQRLQ